MLINRNNYETFFLLYADDELSAEEHRAVESFVSENEDLRGELNMTLAAVLPIEEFSFDIKDSLYKNSFVDGSLQEKLLLKIDNELSVKELKALNKIILTNTAATKEEELLSTAKLDTTEIIICPKKKLLFKKQRDTVVVFRVIRWAAAAVLVGFGLFFGWFIYNKKALPDNIVVIKQNITPSKNKKDNSLTPNNQNIASNSNTNNIKENNKDPQKTQPAIIAASKKNLITNSSVQKKENVNTKELASNNEIQKTIPPIDNGEVKATKEIQTSSLAKAKKVEVAALTNDNMVPLETSFVQTSFTDKEENNNKILYMDEEDVKRSKVGTVIRQFKRMIERTAKTKTGNRIRIAGFQIGAD